MDGNLLESGGTEEGKRGGEAEDEDCFSSVFEGSVRFAHSDSADPIRLVRMKRSLCMVVRESIPVAVMKE
jgi:hypothetical protein